MKLFDERQTDRQTETLVLFVEELSLLKTRKKKDDLKTTSVRKITSMFTKIKKTTPSEDDPENVDSNVKVNPGTSTSDLKGATSAQKPVLLTKLSDTMCTLSNSVQSKPDLAASENYYFHSDQLSGGLLGPNVISDHAESCKP